LGSRKRARLALNGGRSRRQLAKDLGVGFSTLNKWVAKYQQTDLMSDPHDDLAKENARLRAAKIAAMTEALHHFELARAAMKKLFCQFEAQKSAYRNAERALDVAEKEYQKALAAMPASHV
jgi:transposase-like protein